MGLVGTKVTVELRIFATYKAHMIKQSLFPCVRFPTFLTSVSPLWLSYFWHQHPIHFRMSLSKTVIIWTNTLIPRSSSSKVEDMFQRRNVHVCREKLGKSVLIKKSGKNLAFSLVSYISVPGQTQKCPQLTKFTSLLQTSLPTQLLLLLLLLNSFIYNFPGDEVP